MGTINRGWRRGDEAGLPFLDSHFEQSVRVGGLRPREYGDGGGGGDDDEEAASGAEEGWGEGVSTVSRKVFETGSYRLQTPWSSCDLYGALAHCREWFVFHRREWMLCLCASVGNPCCMSARVYVVRSERDDAVRRTAIV